MTVDQIPAPLDEVASIAEALRSEAAIASRPGQYDRLMAQADAVDSVLGEVARLRAALEAAEKARDGWMAQQAKAAKRIDALMDCPQAIHGSFTRAPNGKCPWCEWEDAELRIDAALAIAGDMSCSSYERHNAMRAALTAPEEESRG